MNQKGISTLVIAVIVVVVIAIIGVGVYLAMSGTGGNGDTPTPTPTPAGVADASSLKFSVEVTDGGETYTNNYMVNNIGSTDLQMRIEMVEYDMVYIVNGADQEAWSYMAGEWMDISSAFQENWDEWSTTVDAYQNDLTDWAGTGDYTYTSGGTTIRIYDVEVNPSLSDSLFQPS